jgi:hypothetical protein
MPKDIERIRHSLEIEEHLNLHITGWVVQRIGWGAMLVFIVLGSLGLFGDGFLSRQQIIREGVVVHYERFFRIQAETEIRVHATAEANLIEVKLSPAFTENYRIVRTIPEPNDRRLENGSLAFGFPATGSADIVFVVEPATVGSNVSGVIVNDVRFELSAFIYP